MYGNSTTKRQNEQTNFNPVSPYAVSKLYAHWMVNMYRDAYGLFCCSGILFNHESPLRGDEFVTKNNIKLSTNKIWDNTHNEAWQYIFKEGLGIFNGLC